MIAADRMRQEAGHEAVIVAIGEIGLDYHYMHSPAETQRQVFRLQLEIAAEHELPVIIHMRRPLMTLWRFCALPDDRDYWKEAGRMLR